MKQALRSLVGGILDYAGMFPPAELPFDRAIEIYLRQIAGPDSYLLGRFIVSASRLAELAPYRDRLAACPRAGIIALGRGGADLEALHTGLDNDLRAVAAAHTALGGSVPVDLFETKIQATLLADQQVLFECGERLAASPLPLTTFVEAVGLDDPLSELPRCITALAEARDSGGPRLGFKLRCGGVVASAFPSSETVAAVIAACRDERIPLKCTAGLHHTFRHLDSQSGATMHGFINLYVAGVLAHHHSLEIPKIEAIVADPDPDSFRFSDSGLSWRDLSAEIAAIARARQELMIGFGSCSIDEPQEELAALDS